MIEVSRTERLAALAEPHRLAVADALAQSDLSPTELSRATGQPSNLLAHHLRILEAAGVVRRRRSDADGRRTYLTLAWDDPIVAAAVAPVEAPPGRRVVFVCAGNSARSQMAASLLASHGIAAASAGTRPASALHPFAVAELQRHGLSPLAERPAALADIAREGDQVIAVCDHAYEALSPGRASRHWSVATTDGTREDMARAFEELSPRVERLARALTPGGPA